ncbi:MAG: DUF2970 domain-containing protein [Gammaproteobacteria bacterium]|nr:DUF2970 domain-containing protein [Gammaproteobacteria bacterium]
MTENTEDNQEKKISPFALMGSIFASAFGVQTSKNRERDFQHGKFHHFVIAGIIFAILFVLAVAGIVKIVMSNVGV